MEESNLSQPLNPTRPQIPVQRISIPSRLRSDDDMNVSTPLTPNRTSQKAIKIYQIDQTALTKYKRILQKRVAWSFILLFVLIIERIFAGYTRDEENDLIISLQKSFGITYDSANILLQPIVFLEQYLYFYLMITHFYVIVYYYYNAVVCLKILYVHMNAVALIAILESMFGDPRPYWNSNHIVGVGCENSYGFPSFTVFCILFLFMYSWHCFDEDDDNDEGSWTKSDILKCGVFVVIFGLYCFGKILSGFEYISHILLTILYTTLIFYLATFFDKTVTNLVEKSCIDVQIAKRYTIFWMIYILIFAGIATITYESSETFVDINWFENYFICLNSYQDTQVLKNTPYYHLLGAWGSFLKTVAFFILLGAVFGAAKSFRDFKGVLWYATTKSNKAKMTAVASLCVLPSWMLVFFQGDFIVYLQQGGVDSYIFNAIHFTLLYLILFGGLPKYVFDRWGLINKDSGYYFVADEMIRINSNGA